MLDDAWVRPHRVRDTQQKTSSRDLHNTGLYLKVAHATVLSRAYFTRELRLTRLQSRSFQRLSQRRRSFCPPLEIHGVLELPAAVLHGGYRDPKESRSLDVTLRLYLQQDRIIKFC